MKRTIFLLVICLFLNLFVISSFSLLGAQNSTLKEKSSLPKEPLDYILLRAKKIEDPLLRGTLLIELASANLQLQRSDQAMHILSETLELVQDIESKLAKALVLSGIIDQFISLNKIETALHLAQDIDFPDSRADTLIKIISAYLQQGQYERALRLVREIQEPSFRALALYKIIDWLASKKLFEELPGVEKMVRQEPSSVQTIIRLIQRQNDNDRKDTTLSNLLVSRSPAKKTKALIALAQLKIKANEYRSAEHILKEAAALCENIKGEYVKNECLSQIGIGYVRMGKLEKAHAIAHSVKIPFARAELFAQIALGYNESKNIEEALRVINEVNVQYIKEKVLSKLIIHYIGKKEAELILEKAAGPTARSRIYAAVIEDYLQKKNYSAALAISKKMEDPQIKIPALIKIAKALQKNKQFSEHLRAALLESLSL